MLQLKGYKCMQAHERALSYLTLFLNWVVESTRVWIPQSYQGTYMSLRREIHTLDWVKVLSSSLQMSFESTSSLCILTPQKIHKFLKNVVQFSVKLFKLSPKKKESLNFFGKMWWKSFFGNTHKTRKKLHSKNFIFSENWMSVSCLSFHQNLPKMSELKYTTFNMLLFEVQIFAKISQKWKLGNADSMLYQCCNKIFAKISEKMIVNTRCVLCFMCTKNHEQNNALYWKIRKLTIFK